MKLILNGRFLSQRVTGVQRHARELVRALDRRLEHDTLAGMDVSLLIPPDATLDLDLARIVTRRVGKLRGPLWEQVELPWFSRGQLLLNLANTGPAWAGRQVVTIHDASVFAVPAAYSPAFRHYYRALQPHLAKRAERVLTDSEFSRAELSRWMGVPDRKIRVVPCGHEHILTVPADPSILARHRLGGRPYILAVGSLSRHKNLETVFAAFRLLRGHAWDFVLAGPVNRRVFGSVAEGPPIQIVQVGYVSDAELRALYQSASCLVYPSRYEGFGLPPLEAMACGCPVIVSRCASLPEVCGDAALYVDPDDPQGLAGTIPWILCEEGRSEEMRRRGRERAKHWTWDRAAEQLLGAIRDLVAR
jgi:glycosyltransferase involved in cell wall biosynthesis